MIARKQGNTEKLYEADGHLSAFDATVLSCTPMENGAYAIVLDRTAFFPEGGGQSADRGMLGDARVGDVQIVGDAVVHYTDAPLAAGACVRGEIDYATRFHKMQNHSGEHILSGLIYTTYGYENVGFHLGDDEMTMDISGTLTQEQLIDIEYRANAVVWSNAAITAEYPEPEVLAALPYRSKLALTENVRIVTIEGVDACACCAPHVARTGEIGIIRIMSAMNYKGGMRLWVRCGADALMVIRREHDDLGAIGKLFSTGREDALRSVEKLNREHGELRGALGQCRRELALCRLEDAARSGERHLLFFEQGMDAATMRYMADDGAARCEGICGVFSLTEQGTLQYVCASKNVALRALSKQLNTAFGGRGGGSDVMIQGSLGATEEQLRALFATL